VMATHTFAQARVAAEVIGWAYRFAKQLLGHGMDAAQSPRAAAGV
jgi:hypothetical protein